MPKMPPGNKAKNPGSPLAAYERRKRATTYGPTGGAQPTPSGRRTANKGKPKVNPGSPTAAAERQAKSRATAGSPKAASEREQFKQFGDYLAAKDVKGRGAAAEAGRRRKGLADYVGRSGRKAANTGRPKALPKTK